MIRLFSANETNFDHYETILDKALTCEVTCDENGLFSLTMTHPLDDRIEETKILKVPTPDGEQLFRIAKARKIVGAKHYLDIYARHITYDLLDNLILNIRPTDATQQEALNSILAGTEAPHSFTAQSDVMGAATANYVRMNPIQAIMGQQDNSALNLWGGYLKRDNFLFKVVALSPDKGYEVSFGKNLIGVDDEIDMADVVTRLYPTVVITDNVVTELPEKYVDSTLINNYPHPIIKEYRIALTDEEKALPIADIYTLMRARCADQYTAGADKPRVNYKVDFVQLNKTEQFSMVGFNDQDGKTNLEMEAYTQGELAALAPTWYGQILPLGMLENITISDTVYVEVPLIGVSISARVIKYTYDALWERFNGIEIGNFKPKLTNQVIEFKKLIDTVAKEITESEIATRLKAAIDKITGYTGGHVVTTVNDIGEPTAHIYMDTDDMATCQDYIVVNAQGIAFGDAGLDNPPTVAISIDGSVVAGSAYFSSIKTNLISSDIGSSLDLSSNVSITSKVQTEVTFAIQNDTTKEAAIIKQTTAPAHLAGRLWLDTSVTPNILKRSTGTSWVNASYTSEDIVAVVRNNANYTADLAAAAASRDTKLLKALMEPVKAGHADLLSRMSDLPTDDTILNTAASEELTAYNILQTTFDTVIGNGVIDAAEWTSFDDALAAYQIKESALATAISKATFKITGVLQTRVTAAEEKITADSIINTITSSEVWETTLAGKLNATDLVAGVDNILVEKSYVSKSTVDGQIDTLTSSITSAGESIKDLQTTFTKDINGLSIASGLGSTMELGSSSIRFLMAGQDTYSWDKGVFYTKDVQVTGSIQIGNHKIEKNGTEGTIFVPMGGM